MPDQSEHEFEVIARTYAHLKAFGERPTSNLVEIGRGMGLTDQQINSVRLRASHQVKRTGKPKDVDDRKWVWPSQREIMAEGRMAMA